MKNGAYYGIDFGTTNTSVYLYNYEYGKGSRETGYGTDGKDRTPFSSCIAISKTDPKDIKFGREVKEKINEYAEDYKIILKAFSLILSLSQNQQDRLFLPAMPGDPKLFYH